MYTLLFARTPSAAPPTALNRKVGTETDIKLSQTYSRLFLHLLISVGLLIASTHWVLSNYAPEGEMLIAFSPEISKIFGLLI